MNHFIFCHTVFKGRLLQGRQKSSVCQKELTPDITKLFASFSRNSLSTFTQKECPMRNLSNCVVTVNYEFLIMLSVIFLYGVFWDIFCPFLWSRGVNLFINQIIFSISHMLIEFLLHVLVLLKKIRLTNTRLVFM